MDANEQVIQENTNKSESIVLNLDAQKPANKRKSWLYIILVALVVLLAVVLLNPILGLFKDKQEDKSISDYESEAFDRLTDSLVNAYSKVFNPTDQDTFGANYHIYFNINELAIKMLQQQMPEIGDLSTINALEIDASAAAAGNRYRIQISPKHEDGQLPAIELQYDAASNHIFIILAGLTNNYLDFDISAMSEESLNIDPAQMPAPEELEAVLDAYFDEFIDLMSEEVISEEAVSVDGSEIDCKAHTTQIQYSDLLLLNQRYANEFAKLFGLDSEASDNIIENIEKAFSASEFDTITWTVYTDGQGEIIGRKILRDDEIVVDYIYTDSHFDFNAAFSGVQVIGSGIIEDGSVNGAFEVSLSAEMTKMLLGMDLNLPIKLNVQLCGNDEQRQYIVDYMNLVSVTIDVNVYNPEPILPPEGEAINGSDTDAMYRWMKGMDIEKLKEDLEKIGLSGLLKFFGVG